jgi:nucleotide-binding universal stress UspA family protein
MFKILALTDFSENARDALCVAMRLAQRHGGEVIFAHAMAGTPMPATSPQSLYAELHASDKATYTEMLRKEVQQLFLALKIRHKEVLYKLKVVSLPFAKEMVRLSREHDVDLVVIGSTGANGLKQIIMGNSTLKMVKRTIKPLLIIPRGYAFNGFEHITLIIRPSRFEFRPDVHTVLRLARSYEAVLELLFVTEADEGTPALDDFLLSHNLQQINDFEVTSHTISSSKRVEALKAHLAQSGTDLLVAFPSSRSIWEELFSESLTEEMAYHGEKPLLIIPKDQAP